MQNTATATAGLPGPDSPTRTRCLKDPGALIESSRQFPLHKGTFRIRRKPAPNRQCRKSVHLMETLNRIAHSTG
jgi:hypothetical protein